MEVANLIHIRWQHLSSQHVVQEPQSAQTTVLTHRKVAMDNMDRESAGANSEGEALMQD